MKAELAGGSAPKQAIEGGAPAEQDKPRLDKS
jgi:hypothetical protein